MVGVVIDGRAFGRSLLLLLLMTLTACQSHGAPRTLEVGAGKPYQTLAAAVADASDGDTVAVDAGTYPDESVTVMRSIRIVGVGGKASFVATRNIPNGKAILVARASKLTLENLQFFGASVHDGNGAGIRHEAGTLSVVNCDFADNETGILGGAVPEGRVIVDRSTFNGNGAGDGQTHGLYVGRIASLTVTNSFFYDTHLGSHLKSRAAETRVENSKFSAGPGGDTNYDIDLCEGGEAVVRHNEIDKPANADNRALIHFGGEIRDPVGSLTVEGNLLKSAQPGSVAVLNQTRLPVRFLHNGVGHNVSMIFDGNPIEEIATSKVAD